MALDPVPNGPAPYVAPVPKRPHVGRPPGCKNYSGVSLIAKEMKSRGVDWKAELVEVYKAYRMEKLTNATPDQTLVRFWIELLPYLTIPQAMKSDRGPKPARQRKKGITPAALAELAKAEGRI